MKNLPPCGVVSALCLLFVAGAAPAGAGTITLTLGGTDTGVITLTETGNDTAITAISGTFDGSTIASLLGPGMLGENDNLFYSPAPYLDDYGVSFSLTTPDTNGFSYANLYWVGPPNGDYGTVQSNNAVLFDNGEDFYNDTLTPSGVPEPAPICLMPAGLIGLLTRRRGSQSALRGR